MSIIETKVPEDVRKYKTKVFGPFTTRQLICGVIAVAVDVPLGILLYHFGINIMYLIYIVIIIDVPIMAFCFDVGGVPMRKYLTRILFPSLFAPAKRKYITMICERKEPAPDNKQIKKRQKAEAAAAKKNPDFKSHK